jgi:DNA primase
MRNDINDIDENTNEDLVDLLRDILGKEKNYYSNRGQISFNCPYCDDGRGKGNLEINIYKEAYHCWSCGDSEGTHGHLGKLIDILGKKKHKKLYNLLRPESEQKEIKQKKKNLKLPEGFTKFSDSNPIYPIYKQAKNYLANRGITTDIIEKYQIGFCDKGSHSGRIIVPSFNNEGELNYYIARSWDPHTKMKYKNPEAEKDQIIFNENLIDWKKDIYLVEGVFDGFFLENSIPMLGKHLSQLLFDTLYEKSKKNIIICLDGDAFQNGLKLYHELNGGKLYGKIKIVQLPKDKDVCDLRGQIDEYYITIKD